MITLKRTQRSIVKLAFDGHIHKQYQGSKALERLTNELRVLLYLEDADCPFVPRVVGFRLSDFTLVQSNCGRPVEYLNDCKVAELFAHLLEYGVEHDDACLRNITYRLSDGQFCLVDFEFARILNQSSLVERIEHSLDLIENLTSRC